MQVFRDLEKFVQVGTHLVELAEQRHHVVEQVSRSAQLVDHADRRGDLVGRELVDERAANAPPCAGFPVAEQLAAARERRPVDDGGRLLRDAGASATTEPAAPVITRPRDQATRRR